MENGLANDPLIIFPFVSRDLFSLFSLSLSLILSSSSFISKGTFRLTASNILPQMVNHRMHHVNNKRYHRNIYLKDACVPRQFSVDLMNSIFLFFAKRSVDMCRYRPIYRARLEEEEEVIVNNNKRTGSASIVFN